MKVTEVRIKILDPAQAANERLSAFASITLDDCFVVRDLKIVFGEKGHFVAMPSRKLTDRCWRCGSKNRLQALYCDQCGQKQAKGRAVTDAAGRAHLHADIAHPINAACREMIAAAVLEAYRAELAASQLPGYVCGYHDAETAANVAAAKAPVGRVRGVA